MKFWSRFALACWLGDRLFWGWMVCQQAKVMSATGPMVVCYVIAAARARQEQRKLS